MVQEKTRELIMQLQAIKKERNLSYQNIVDLVEASGGQISISTVRRVFAPGAEEKSFRYEETVKPLVVVLLGINEPPPVEADIETPEQLEIRALKNVIGIKEELAQQTKAELAYIRDEANKKHEHITQLTAQIKRRDRAVFWLSFVLIGLLLAITAALVIDRIDPGLGYFWRSISAQRGGPDDIVQQISNSAALIFT